MKTKLGDMTENIQIKINPSISHLKYIIIKKRTKEGLKNNLIFCLQLFQSIQAFDQLQSHVGAVKNILQQFKISVKSKNLQHYTRVELNIIRYLQHINTKNLPQLFLYYKNFLIRTTQDIMFNQTYAEVLYTCLIFQFITVQQLKLE